MTPEEALDFSSKMKQLGVDKFKLGVLEVHFKDEVQSQISLEDIMDDPEQMDALTEDLREGYDQRKKEKWHHDNYRSS